MFNIHIVAKYVNTKSNLVADTLSRVLYLKTEDEARKCLQGSVYILQRESWEGGPEVLGRHLLVSPSSKLENANGCVI